MNRRSLFSMLASAFCAPLAAAPSKVNQKPPTGRYMRPDWVKTGHFVGDPFAKYTVAETLTGFPGGKYGTRKENWIIQLDSGDVILDWHDEGES